MTHRVTRRDLMKHAVGAGMSGMAGPVSLAADRKERQPTTSISSLSPEIAERVRRVENGLLLPTPVFENYPPERVSLASRMEHHNCPGVSIAVIRDGTVEWARGYGFRQAGKSRPVSVDTLFQAGSISKPVAAVAALRLIEQGRLDLDEDVNRFLVSWKVPRNGSWQPRVTLRQLLSHTAGMTVHGFGGYSRKEPAPSLVQVLNGEKPANTRAILVNTVPGTQFRYSGGGTSVVQQMLIDVTRKPFPELMRELVLDPLGMADSTYEQPLPEARSRAAATAHVGEKEPVEGKWHVYPEIAAAGLWTTPADLARFAIEIQSARAGKGAKLLSREMVEQMLTPQVEDHIGLGVFLEGEGAARRFGHGGVDHGFVANLKAYTDAGLGAVVMTNAYSGDLCGEILKAVAAEYAWPDYVKPKRTVHVDPGVLGPYVGQYELRPGFEFSVTRKEDSLLLQPAGQPAIELFPESDTRFFARAVNMEVTFVRGESRVTQLIFRQNSREMPAKRKD
jgi:CubicO group peptidase (beta-lactamase class C family)